VLKSKVFLGLVRLFAVAEVDVLGFMDERFAQMQVANYTFSPMSGV